MFVWQLRSFFCDLQEEASLPNLLVVCGDHGMSETGSHGGSSEGEVHTPLLFISSAFEKRSGKYQGSIIFLKTVLVSDGIELVFFLVAGTALFFGFSVRIMLVTHWCLSVCSVSRTLLFPMLCHRAGTKGAIKEHSKDS